jgi:hypothetical protein
LLFSGRFVVPTATSDGTCSDGNFMRFLHSDTRSCKRVVADLQAACTSGVLSGVRYAESIAVGTLPSALAALTQLSWVTSTINSVLHDVSFIGSTDLGNLQSDGSYLLPFVLPRPFWNASTCTCQNVLKSVTYTMTHTTAGAISSTTSNVPKIDVVLTDLKGETMLAPIRVSRSSAAHRRCM